MAQPWERYQTGPARQIGPGDPVATEQERVQLEREQLELEELRAERRLAAERNAFRRGTGSIRDSLKDRLGSIDRALSASSNLTTGLFGWATSLIPGANEPREALQNAVGELSGSIMMEQVQSMRRAAQEAGATGSGLGQITEREVELLISALGSLNPNAGDQEMISQLERMGQVFQRTLNAMEYEAEFPQTTQYRDGRVFQWQTQVPSSFADIPEEDWPEHFRGGEPGENVPGQDQWSGPTGTPQRDEDPLAFYNRLLEAGHEPAEAQASAQSYQEFLNERRPAGVPIEAMVFEEGQANLVDASTAADTAAAFLDSAGANIPAYLLGEQEVMKARRARTPIGTAIGDVAGYVAGGVGGGALATRGLMRLGNTGRNIAQGGGRAGSYARSAAGGATEGGVVGGMREGDPVGGALAGTVGGTVGRFLGGRLANVTRGREARIAAATRDMPSSRQLIEDRLAADGLTPEDAILRLAEAERAGVPSVMADLTPALRSRAAAYGRSADPQTRSAIADPVNIRQYGGPGAPSQAQRVTGHIERNLGDIPANRLDAADALTAQARAASAPLYERAMQAGDVWSDELAGILRTPFGRKALGRAQEIAENEQRDWASAGIRLSAEGEVVVSRTPTMETMDLVKRAMDDVIEANRDPVTLRLTLDAGGRAENTLRSRFLRELDDLNPVYAEARAAYAGPARQRTALEAGRRASGTRTDNAALERLVRDMGPDEIEHFRIGFRSGLSERIGTQVDGGDRVRNLLGTPNRRRAIGLAFEGEEGLDTFMRAMDAEESAFRTFNAIRGNSATAERIAAQTDLPLAQVQAQPLVSSGYLGTAVAGARQGGITGALTNVAARATGDVPAAGASRARALREQAARLAERQEAGVLGSYAPEARGALAELSELDRLRGLAEAAELQRRTMLQSGGVGVFAPGAVSLYGGN